MTGNLRDIELVSFDCYGTLIDWESGILAAMIPVILSAYARAEAAVEAGPYLSYAEVLRRTFCAMAKDLGFGAAGPEVDTLVEALPSWPCFPDTVAALRRLSTRLRLAVVSNVDEALFAATAEVLDVRFDAVVTAERVGAYKPDPRVFIHAIDVVGVARDRHLHAAQSAFHDLVPAGRLGLRTAHVVRASGRASSAVPEVSAGTFAPDLVVADLRGLADALGV